MPYLKIQTNLPLDDQATETLMAKASRLVAKQLGKPESYVMVAVDAPKPMLFAGDAAPLGYLELKSVGLLQAKTADLSQALCKLMEEEAGINKGRIYIEFASASGPMWGWDGSTF